MWGESTRYKMRLEETRSQILILEVALRFFCRDKNTQTLHKVRAERACSLCRAKQCHEVTLHKVRAERACSLCRAKQRHEVTIKQSDNQAFLQHLTSNPIAKCRDGFVAKCRGGFMSKCRGGFMSKCRGNFVAKCRGLSKNMYLCIRKY